MVDFMPPTKMREREKRQRERQRQTDLLTEIPDAAQSIHHC
jgi:hypothetical protein